MKRLLDAVLSLLTNDRLFPWLCFGSVVIAFAPFFVEKGCEAVFVGQSGQPLGLPISIRCERCGGWSSADGATGYYECLKCGHRTRVTPAR